MGLQITRKPGQGIKCGNGWIYVYLKLNGQIKLVFEEMPGVMVQREEIVFANTGQGGPHFNSDLYPCFKDT